MKNYNPLSILILFLLNTFTFAQGPAFQWAKSFGDSNTDSGESIAVSNSTGNVYTVGEFSGTIDFDPGPGIYNLTPNGSSGVFISKLDKSGNFIWAKKIDGNYDLQISSVKIDASDNIYIVGFFYGSVDFDPGVPAQIIASTNNTSSHDVFIEKLDSSGNLIWIKTIEGSGDDYGYDLALDLNANVFITGTYKYTADFDPSSAIFSSTSSGGSADGFVLKLDTNGNFVWVKTTTDVDPDDANNFRSLSITTDLNGNIYTTGWFIGPVDFDPNAGIYILTAGSQNLFIQKLDTNGNLLWAEATQGTGFNEGECIITDTQNNIYISGTFGSTVDFNPGTGVYTLTETGLGTDIFLLKLNSNGTFQWANQIGGSLTDEETSVDIDYFGDIYLAGNYIAQADFDPSANTYFLISFGSSDAFIEKFDANGNFIWVKTFGGVDIDKTSCIDVNQSGEIYSTGTYQNTVDFDPGTGVYNLTSVWSGNPLVGYSYDAFVLKLGSESTFISENNFSNSLYTVFPNPTSGEINILLHDKSDNIVLQVKNILGQTIYSNKFISTNIISLNIDYTAKGLYFIEILKQNSDVITIKVNKN